jgi:hypothetical protein
MLALFGGKPKTSMAAPTPATSKPSPEPSPRPSAPVAQPQMTGAQATWPALGTNAVGETVLYFAGSWKKGIIKEIGVPYDASHRNAAATENKYKIAPEAYQNWPEWVHWSQVVIAEREPFWMGWYTGAWELGEVMAVNTRREGNYQRNWGYHAAVESLQVNANGTYVWKPLSHPVISGKWVPAPDGPGIVLQKGYKNLNWTLRNESSAVELIIRKVENVRLFPATNTIMSITAKRNYSGTR